MPSSIAFKRDCFICQSKDYKTINSTDRYNIVQCRKCGLMFENTLNLVESNCNYDIYSEEDSAHYSLLDLAVREKKRQPLRLDLLKFIMKYRRGKGEKLLDVGCSSGDFLKLAQAQGFDVYGVDVSENACQIAQSKIGGVGRIFKGELEEQAFPANYFDVINLGATLVQLDAPDRFMKEAFRVLKTGGHLFICDNSYSWFRFSNWAYRFLLKRRRNYDSLVNFFNLKTFRKFIATTPFKLEEVIQYYYSDKLIQEYVPASFKTHWLIKWTWLFLRVTKVDRLMRYPRLFLAILRK